MCSHRHGHIDVRSEITTLRTKGRIERIARSGRLRDPDSASSEEQQRLSHPGMPAPLSAAVDVGAQQAST
jgi:hypothetical protein